MNQNFTPIDFLVNQPTPTQSQPISTGTVERHEPIGAAHLESPTPTEVHTDEQDDKRNQDYIDKHVEVKSNVPEIPADVAAAGVQAIGSGAPGVPQTVLKLPLPDDQIPADLKKPVSSGVRWLAEICVYMLRKAHLKLKEVHGKVTRVKG